QPRKDELYAFDDQSDQTRRLWGLYATRSLGGHEGIDVYYLGYHNDAGPFEQGTEDERRQTFGVRYFGTRNGWDWNWEPMVQVGRFGDSSLFAWTVAAETGYQWSDVVLKPHVLLSTNVASGDSNLNDPGLGTFNPLFPRGSYFSENSIFGPQNFYNAHLFVTVHPSAIWSVTVDYNMFYRFSQSDGVYQPGGFLLRPSRGSDSA